MSDEHTLFREGHWGKLKEGLEKSVNARPADAKAALQLGTLLVIDGDPQAAITHFNTALKQNWEVGVALNNKGVAFALMNEAAASVECFCDRCIGDGIDTAAWFNLGIILNSFKGGYRVPPDAVRRAVEKAGIPDGTSEAAKHCFKNASDLFQYSNVKAVAEKRPLDGPLFLRPDELPAGFGFESTKELAGQRQAEALQAKGEARLKEGEWLEALSLLTRAEGLSPLLRTEVRSKKQTALRALCDEYYQKAEAAFDQGKDKEGLKYYAELIDLLPEVEDFIFITDLLVGRIDRYIIELRRGKSNEHWMNLVDVARIAEEKLIGIKASVGQELAERLEKKLRKSCCKALNEQISKILQAQDINLALSLAAVIPHLWFYDKESPVRVCSIYSSVAKTYIDNAIKIIESKPSSKMIEAAREALDTALRYATEADDEALVEAVMQLFKELDPIPDLETVRAELNRHLENREFKDFFQKIKDIKQKHPDEQILETIREKGIADLSQACTAALNHRLWNVADEHLELLLLEKSAVDAKLIGSLSKRLRDGRVSDLLPQIDYEISHHHWQKAKRLCNAAEILASDKRPIHSYRMQIRQEEEKYKDQKRELDAISKLVGTFQSAIRKGADGPHIIDHALKLFNRVPDWNIAKQYLDNGFSEFEQWAKSLLSKGLRKTDEREILSVIGLLENLKVKPDGFDEFQKCFYKNLNARDLNFDKKVKSQRPGFEDKIKKKPLDAVFSIQDLRDDCAGFLQINSQQAQELKNLQSRALRALRVKVRDFLDNSPDEVPKECWTVLRSLDLSHRDFDTDISNGLEEIAKWIENHRIASRNRKELADKRVRLTKILKQTDLSKTNFNPKDALKALNREALIINGTRPYLPKADIVLLSNRRKQIMRQFMSVDRRLWMSFIDWFTGRTDYYKPRAE